jgi:hypothetical protein
MKRNILWGAFLVSTVLAVIDLLFIRGLFSWMILLPLVLVTGLANVGVSLWKKEGRNALLALLVTLVLCGAYVALLAWSLT